MTCHPPSYSLSIEEFAFALGAVGGAEAALGFLSSTLGQMPEQERTLRLTVASHSLLARGLISFDAAANRRTTEPEFERMLSTVLRATATIRCTRTHAGDEEVLTVFVGKGNAVASQVINAVTIMLSVNDSRAKCLQSIAQHIHADPAPAAEPVGMTNTALLDMLNTAASSEVDEQAVRLLRDSNFESDLAQQIVRQVRAATARGSVLSISGPQTNTNAAQDVGVIADVGFVFASGPSSGWLFAVEPDTTDALSIYPTTAGAVGKICTAFIAEF